MRMPFAKGTNVGLSGLVPRKADCYKRARPVSLWSLAFYLAMLLFFFLSLPPSTYQGFLSDAGTLLFGIFSHQNLKPNKPLYFLHCSPPGIML